MTAPDGDQDPASDLAHARALAAAGVPILVARPVTGSAGEWNPDAGVGGYILPARWQQTEADPAVLDRWRPGDAVVAVMGHGLDLLDYDPRSGGDETYSAQLEAGILPVVYAEAETPSGGFHLFVRSLRVPSRDNLAAGCDLKAGIDGHGHGCAFIAPTRKKSKDPGEQSGIRPYRWSMPPDLERFADDAADDDSGAAIADLVRQRSGPTSVSAGAATAPPGGGGYRLPGRIPVGRRHAELVSYAASLRAKDTAYDVAVVAMTEAWRRCEQPYEIEDVRRVLDDTYRTRPPGTERRRGEALRIDPTGGNGEARSADPGLSLPALDRLSDMLARPREPVTYRIERVLRAGAKVLFVAQHKAGKTVVTLNIARCLVDGEPFLGCYATSLPEGDAVAIVDDEMSEEQFIDWCADMGFRAADRIRPVLLRGRVSSFDLRNPDIRSHWAQQLRDAGVTVLIIDCLRPILDALGLDESREAGRFLTVLDALCREAGIREWILVHHMGHRGERARGDSGLRGWPDCEWFLLKSKTDDGEDDPRAPRYFAAYGRDIDVREVELAYDPATRRLTIADTSNARGDRKSADARAALVDIVRILDQQPEPVTGRGIEDLLATVTKHSRTAIRAAVQLGHEDGTLTRHPNPGRGGGFAWTTEQTGRHIRATTPPEPSDETPLPDGLDDPPET